MRINPTYQSLISKSVSSMLSAIEIYNKPNFFYREETFAILAVNSIELLLKAHLLKVYKFNNRELYVLEPILKKDNKPHKTKKTPKLNRSKNPMTINLFECISKLQKKDVVISKNFLDNIESLVELRDNSVHFLNDNTMSKLLQEIGFATIKNYIHIIKLWNIDVDLSSYNLYLMPLAYVDARKISTGVLTDEVQNYFSFVKNKIDNAEEENVDFDIAISIDVSFKKENSFGELGFKYDEENGIPIVLTEENIKKKFPLTHKDICKQAKQRYEDFKQNQKFNALMSGIKKDSKLCHVRKLNIDNPDSGVKPYYNGNIWRELDKEYRRKK